ncbi:MAG: SAM-dependent methyltransferase [Flavobacteriales bacterium]|nr:SAM-dependent methyltransferase [Flavobacteriales bacterium]
MNQDNKSGTLFLIPNFLSAETKELPVPDYVKSITQHIHHFVVESDRPARKLMAKIWGVQNLNHLDFWVIDPRSRDMEMEKEILSLLKQGKDVGLISDAGYPSVGDPGESVVFLAHKSGYRVKPLIGPNSFIMALSASGLNAEKFTFHGYLPKDKAGRISSLKELEAVVRKNGYSQIFMETPYRNSEMIKEITQNLNGELYLSISWDITGPDEFIFTQKIADWKNYTPDEKTDKLPAVFVLGVL